ncbi:MAG: ornithine cyclodeaminase family protein, partial [candidate division NC10 bacterium]|nr:ornithine cyclodeaminase family protein [candidate division NC10 bacterium]
RLLTMAEALEAVEEAFRQHGQGSAVNRPRARVRVPQGILHVMAAGLPPEGVLGFKAYTAFGGTVRFHVHLYSAEDGRLLAIMEADRLGRIRTGAASGVATRYLARPGASVVGIFGTGWQAGSQLQAICAVREVREIRAYGRDAARRVAFCREMEAALQVPVRPAPEPRAVVEGADIVTTMTTAKAPVFDGRWLEEGTHLNAAGSNFPQKQEIDKAAVTAARRIVVDSKEQAQIECGDLIAPISRGLLSWDQVHELGEVVAGKIPGRERPEDITLFESQGLALEDMAVAAVVYRKALREKVGRELPL